MNRLILAFFAVLFFGAAFAVSFADVNAPNASGLDNNSGVDKNAVKSPVVSEPQEVLSARKQIVLGEELIKKIADANINTERVSDLLLIAKNSLDEAVLRAGSSSRVDLSGFNSRYSEFVTVSQLAFSSHDELMALKVRMDKSSDNIKDMSPVDEIYARALVEFEDQRYERVMDLILEADTKIIDLTSLNTQAEVMYEAAASNIKSIVSKYWLEIVVAVVVPLILFLIFRAQIKRSRLRKKIESLEIEKNVLHDEIKRAQNEYFVLGKMAEGVFYTRVNVFGEMIRDLTREIALLKEEEQKLNTIKALNHPVKKKDKK